MSYMITVRRFRRILGLAGGTTDLTIQMKLFEAKRPDT